MLNFAAYQTHGLVIQGSGWRRNENVYFILSEGPNEFGNRFLNESGAIIYSPHEPAPEARCDAAYSATVCHFPQSINRENTVDILIGIRVIVVAVIYFKISAIYLSIYFIETMIIAGIRVKGRH